jgi:hypothetical protein
VDDCRILDVGPFTDADVIHVSANDRTEPNARIGSDLDIAYDDRVTGDERCFMDLRDAVSKRFYHDGGLDRDRFRSTAIMAKTPALKGAKC